MGQPVRPGAAATLSDAPQHRMSLGAMHGYRVCQATRASLRREVAYCWCPSPLISFVMHQRSLMQACGQSVMVTAAVRPSNLLSRRQLRRAPPRHSRSAVAQPPLECAAAASNRQPTRCCFSSGLLSPAPATHNFKTFTIFHRLAMERKAGPDRRHMAGAQQKMQSLM